MITFGEYFERRNQGETVTAIAKSLGTSNKAINRRLNEAGYVSEGNQWIWRGEGKEPLEKEMVFSKSGQRISTSASKSKVDSNIETDSDVTSHVTSHVTSRITGKDEDMDIFDSILNSPKKGKGRNYRGFYLSEETLNFLDKIESGRRSEFVDECIKKIARDKGLL